MKPINIVTLDSLYDVTEIFPDMEVGDSYATSIESDPDEDLNDPAEEMVVQDDELSIKDLNPLVTLSVLKEKFGSGWWELEHDALVEVVTGGRGMPPSDRDLIRSLQLMYADESFWTEWEIFNWVTTGLTDEPVDFGMLGVLDVRDMLTSMIIADLISKDQHTIANYSPEVLSYIAVTALEEGIWAFPTPMSVAQNRAEELLKMRGWESLPVARVRALAYNREHIPMTGDINVQAHRYRTLVSYRATLLKRAEAEIAIYRGITDDGNDR